MRKYEYTWTITPHKGLDDRVKYLDEMGMDGWLLVEISYGATEIHYLFVREKL